MSQLRSWKKKIITNITYYFVEKFVDSEFEIGEFIWWAHHWTPSPHFWTFRRSQVGKVHICVSMRLWLTIHHILFEEYQLNTFWSRMLAISRDISPIRKGSLSNLRKILTLALSSKQSLIWMFLYITIRFEIADSHR